MKSLGKRGGASRDLNPGPPAPKAGIIATRPRAHSQQTYQPFLLLIVKSGIQILQLQSFGNHLQSHQIDMTVNEWPKVFICFWHVAIRIESLGTRLVSRLEKFGFNVDRMWVYWSQTFDVARFELAICKHWNFHACQRVFTLKDLNLLKALSCNWVVVQLQPCFCLRQIENTALANRWLLLHRVEVMCWTATLLDFFVRLCKVTCCAEIWLRFHSCAFSEPRPHIHRWLSKSIFPSLFNCLQLLLYVTFWFIFLV